MKKRLGRVRLLFWNL